MLSVRFRIIPEVVLVVKPKLSYFPYIAVAGDSLNPIQQSPVEGKQVRPFGRIPNRKRQLIDVVRQSAFKVDLHSIEQGI